MGRLQFTREAGFARCAIAPQLLVPQALEPPSKVQKAEAVAPSLAAADEDMEVEPWSKKHWNQQI